MASQNIPPKSGNGPDGDTRPEVLPPEELALLKERLRTIDQAVSAEELLAMLDDDLRRGGGGR